MLWNALAAVSIACVLIIQVPPGTQSLPCIDGDPCSTEYGCGASNCRNHAHNHDHTQLASGANISNPRKQVGTCYLGLQEACTQMVSTVNTAAECGVPVCCERCSHFSFSFFSYLWVPLDSVMLRLPSGWMMSMIHWFNYSPVNCAQGLQLDCSLSQRHACLQAECRQHLRWGFNYLIILILFKFYGTKLIPHNYVH